MIVMLQLLEEVCSMGRDQSYICQKPQPKLEAGAGVVLRSAVNPDPASSDDEDDDDEVGSTHSSTISKQQDGEADPQAQ